MCGDRLELKRCAPSLIAVVGYRLGVILTRIVNHRPRRQCRMGLRCALAIALFTLIQSSETMQAAEPEFPVFLSFDQQLTLARTFAPTLVFHPDEDFFPTSSMGRVAAEAALDDWPSRVKQYRSLSTTDKLQRAALAYRVFSRVNDRHLEVVVEYWCYYVYNAFTVRGGWLPFRVPNNHPHDLERLYLVLRPTSATWSRNGAGDDIWARESFRIHRVVANAHDGSIPPNQYQVPDKETIALPISVLVERGSHAMAPDLNEDGWFTPGIDSTHIHRPQWGIRDRGSTWRWYRDSYMDGRDRSAVRLCGPASAVESGDPVCTRYGLYPADGLQRWFEEQQLSDQERKKIMGHTPWLVRTFGDIRVEDLMVPIDPANGRMLEKMLRRRVGNETGFVTGFTTVDRAPAFVVGGRSMWEVPSRHSPDLLTEATALVPSGREVLVEATAWAVYNVDAITNVLVGFGWFSESQSTSLAVGAEVRVGRFRVRPAWRIRDRGFDSRVTMIF
jgi:hypothetical protein